MKNIVLIGLPGSGKTTIGRLLAEKLERLFADTDARIKAETGATIQELFDTEGEAHFRDRETETLRRLLRTEGQVIATGGGIILRQENRELLQSAAVFFIDRPVKEIMSTTIIDGRPLLRTKTLEVLSEERRALYLQCADFSVNEPTPQEMVDAIVKKGEELCVF